jgi:Flp pilus assembly protein TadD
MERKAEIYYSQGTSDLIQKEYTSALQHFRNAYEINPNNPDLLNNMAMAYFFKEELGFAEEYLLQALKIKPDHSDARSNLAAIYLTRGETERAEAEFMKVAKDLVYQNQFRVHYNLGIIQLGKKKYEDAKKAFKESLMVKEDYCPSHFQLGKIYYEQKQFSEALEHFRSASHGTCYSEPSPVYYQGLCYMMLGNGEKARLKFEEIITRFPQNSLAVLAKDKLSDLTKRYSQMENFENREDHENGPEEFSQNLNQEKN